MLCYVMLCYVMLCYVMLCYVMLCCVTLRYVALRCVTLRYMILYDMILYYIIYIFMSNYYIILYIYIYIYICRSQWPLGLRRRSMAARLLRSWVRIPPGARTFLSCVCCQVEVSATGWSLVQRSPTDCGASLCVITEPLERGGHSVRWAAERQEGIACGGLQSDRRV
jgi:hypothetical protein